MRVLLVSLFYDPEPNFKAGPLGFSLAARGHEVTALTGFPSYPHGRIYPGYHQRLWQFERRDGVRVLRVPLYPDHSRSAFRRALHYLSFAGSATLLGSVFCRDADVMWVYHPPLTAAIPAWWIGLLRQVPFVLEVQDIWPDTISVTGMVSNQRLLSWIGRLADFFYRRAAAIIVISHGFKSHLVARGIPSGKIHVIPNWADEDVYRPVPPVPDLEGAYGMTGRFNVIYAGNIGPAQALQTVLDAAVLLQDLPAVQFVLIGEGMDREDLKKQAQARGLENVRFLAHQPAERMPHFYAQADALLVHLKRDPLYEITIPSKILAYMACGRPILCAVGGDAADVVVQAGAGVVCPPQDPAKLANAVRRLVAMPPQAREALGRAGRRTFLDRYTRRALVDRYEGVLKGVIEQKSGHRVEVAHNRMRP